MRKFLLLAGGLLFLISISGCGSESSSATAPTTTGISGTVEYTGSQKGGILIYASNEAPKQNEAPKTAAIEALTKTSGQFNWNLPPGTYYIVAFLTINREPQGPLQPNEPAVNCDPVQVNENENVKVEIVLTDEDIGSKNRSCLKKN